MKLCSDEHEEVCYEGRQCPACTVKEELGAEIDQLNKQVIDLKDQLRELNADFLQEKLRTSAG